MTLSKFYVRYFGPKKRLVMIRLKNYNNLSGRKTFLYLKGDTSFQLHSRLIVLFLNKILPSIVSSENLS